MSPDPVHPLVIGVGNRDRGDDAIGPLVADTVAGRWPGRVETAVVEGDLSTLPLLWSADRPVVVIDAAVPAQEDSAGIEPGTVVEFDGLIQPWPMGAEMLPLSTHGIGLATAVDLARRLCRLPRSLTVLAVAVPGRSFHHQAPLSPQVGRQVDAIADRVGEILNLYDRSLYPGNGEGKRR